MRARTSLGSQTAWSLAGYPMQAVVRSICSCAMFQRSMAYCDQGNGIMPGTVCHGKMAQSKP